MLERKETGEGTGSGIPMRALLAGARRKERGLLDLIQKLVLVESPSDDKAAVDACGPVAADYARGLGGRVKVHRQRGFGNVIEARFGLRGKAAEKGRILLLGHIDTVWPVGTLKTMPCRIANGRLWGPGTLDMKAGVAMALTAIEMLGEAGLLDREIVLLLNSEEEVGSPVSRPITEQIARECSTVYVLEPAQGLAYKTARKGTGNWRIEIKGMAAHAGVDFEKGASAVRELARVIDTVSGWTDLDRGLTVSVGLVGGGSKTNVIPADAHCPQGRRTENRTKIRRPEGSGQTLHCDRNGRHQSPAHGAHAGNRGVVSASQGSGSRTRLRTGRSGHRGRVRWQLYFGTGRGHAGWDGRSRRGSARTPRVGGTGAPGSAHRAAGGNAVEVAPG